MLPEFERERSFHSDALPGGGALERNAGGMEKEAGERARGRAVEFVAHDGVAQAREVCPDLVRTARADADFEQCEILEALQDSEFGERRAALAQAGGHAGAMDRVAGNG